MEKPSGIEQDLPQQPIAQSTPDELGHFHLDQQHVRLTQVILRDQTDIHNELVFEQEWLLHTAEHDLELAGNLFVFENVFTASGKIVLKTEALPHARPQPVPADVRVTPGAKGGFEVSVLGGESERWVLLEYSGGEVGRTAALHAYQQSQRPDTLAHRLPRFLSNTWGDRSRDSRIEQGFIAREISAGSRLGVEVIQIDDGWMQGVTKNSARSAQAGGVWEGFWNQDPHFWQPSPERFPDGLEPLVEVARARGVQLGLWFGPDSWNDFANWQRDADCLLDFYRRLGIAHFKLDGIRMDTPAAQTNLRSFMSAVLSGSDGQVLFDLDVTAQTRPGYFGAIEAGPLFVENRYTDWHRYWPHQTLRNLWKLARWVDPRRLRMEWLNQTRNAGQYPNDPLAPAAWAPDALFATVMFSNPLGWFEVSNLPRSYFERAAPLVAIWKQEREALFGGTLLPVGAPPDGVSWSGFVSLSKGGSEGYLLLFRQLGGEVGRVRLPVPSGRLCWKRLAGSGRLEIVDGEALAYGVEPLGYIFAHFEV
jgi:alpha-galactosidase